MNRKSINELNEIYDLELEKVLKEIKKSNAKFVLLQFPDGLKQFAATIVDYFREELKNKVEFLIWMGSCYGACDTPVGLENLKPKIDLVIQFGHNELIPNYN